MSTSLPVFQISKNRNSRRTEMNLKKWTSHRNTDHITQIEAVELTPLDSSGATTWTTAFHEWSGDCEQRVLWRKAVALKWFETRFLPFTKFTSFRQMMSYLVTWPHHIAECPPDIPADPRYWTWVLPKLSASVWPSSVGGVCSDVTWSSGTEFHLLTEASVESEPPWTLQQEALLLTMSQTDWWQCFRINAESRVEGRRTLVRISR